MLIDIPEFNKLTTEEKKYEALERVLRDLVFKLNRENEELKAEIAALVKAQNKKRFR